MAAPDAPDPRSGPTAETADAVLTTAFHLLVDEGLGSLTPSRLHRETGVARTTIYRHWPSSADIVADLLVGATRRDDVDNYTGDLDHDVRVAVATLTFRFEHRPLRALFGALMGVDRREGEAMSVGEEYVRGLLAPISDVVTAAVDRGELDASVSVQAMVAELAGPLFLRHALLGDDIPAGDVERSVEAFLGRYRT